MAIPSCPWYATPSLLFRPPSSSSDLGADDDGSGSVTILESYRALIAANFRPIRPVEFHWYSAEVGIVTWSQVFPKFNYRPNL